MHKTQIFRVFSSLMVSLFFIPQFTHAQTNDPNMIVETAVRMVFANTPDMITIAKCESGFRQFAPNGSVLHGGNGGRYIGIFQFDEAIHSAKALSMGYDLNTIDGNIGYAKYEYSVSGANPWKSCLSTATPAPAPTPAPTPSGTPAVIGELTSTLDYGQTSPQVLILQQTLNKIGFQVAASGPGSPGNETSTFASLTRAAVQKFQCEKGIVCSGNAGSTGFGRVGPRTLAALNQAAGF